MRIAIYAGTFKKDQDGATKTIYRLVHSLLLARIQVGVWGFSITPQKRRGLGLVTVPSLPLFLYRDYRVTFPTPRVMRSLRTFAPDLIHITVPDFVSIAFFRYARKNRIPVIATYHTRFPAYLKYFKMGFLTRLAWKMAVRFYRRTNTVYAPTEMAARELSSRGVSNVKIWSRGVEHSQYSPSFRSKKLRKRLAGDRCFIILFSGRLVWYKDVHIFADVYDLYQAYAPGEVQFALAGDGPARQALEKRMPDAVFTGYLYGRDLSRIYASSDLLLFPSVTESFGNVVHEALASGIPAVVADQGGCQEIIENSGGGLVARSGDARDFFAKCRLLLENPHLYAEKKRAARRYIKGRSWESVNRELIKDLVELAGRPALPAPAPPRRRPFLERDWF